MKKFSRSMAYWIISSITGLALVSFLFFAPSVYGQDVDDFEQERLFRTFRSVYDFVRQNYVEEVDPDVLIEGAMKGMFESLGDPYSVYLDATDMRSLTDTTSGEFGGVGIYINKVSPNDERPGMQEWVEIVSPIEGTPAYRAGIRPRDLIIEIEGESTVEMTSDEVVNRLRGEPGTDVEITILRNMRNSFKLTLTRAIIEIPTVRHAGIEGHTGYVRIIQFTPNTASRVETAIRDLEAQGYTDLIIDLRTNPGGLLDSAVETADLFFDDGLVVGTAGRVAVENTQFHARRGTVPDEDARIIVLINEGTASAAEILAGALKDRDRAVIVGQNSFGKGSVQQVRTLGTTGFRLTMARYYTPDEIFIDKIGIAPDVVVEEPEYSEAENEALSILQDEDRISAFLDRVEDRPTEAQIQAFLRELRAEGLEAPERIVRRLITLEREARTNESSVYDLEYDLVLQKALEIMRDDQVQAIIDGRTPATSMGIDTPGLPVPALQ